MAPEPATPDAVPAEPAPAEPAALPEIIPGAPASEPEPEIIPAPGAAPLAPAPQPGFATVPSSRLPQIGGGDAAPADGAVSPEAPAAVTPRIIAVAPSAPQPGFNRSVPGVKINRLPAVGAAGAGAGAPPIGGNTEGEGAAGAVLPEAGPKPALPGKPLILTAPKAEPVDPALTRFAAAFANPDGRPLLAVVLRDSGDAAALTAARTLAAAGVALTLAVDPLGSDPAARAAAFRAAGLEVALDLPVLPADATASDLEVAYEGAIGLVPGAVAVIASPDAAFQSDRQTAQHLVSMLAPEGLGLVTWSRGLNPALQAAERESVPAMAIYRDLDSGGESPETIARSLDRAAFEAERVGRVVLFGHADAATVGALVQWQARGGKAAILGPVSAALGDGGGSGGGG
ncbi:MAG: divergent polysaccharide deacetylase family protein [Defluviimonas sp.]|nr:divergent polysaccharide deacetylase family protein [Defluviimonas sp.]